MVLSTAAMVLAGCAQNEELNPVETPININAITEKASKAAINSPENLAAAGGFYVWGYKTIDSWSTSTQIFNKQSVTSTSGTYNSSATETSWTYTPTKYWDKNATYNFYAAGPNTATWSFATTDNGKTGKIGLSGAQSLRNDDETSNDYVICRSVVNNPANYLDNVNFTFNHIMSKIMVKLKTNVTDATITVTELTMTGWNNADGSFEQNKVSAFSAAEKKNDEWTLATGGSTTAAATFVIADGEKTLVTESPTALASHFIMVPQTIAASGLSFTVTYTIKYSDNITETQTKTGTLAAAQTWATDCVTTYTLTVGPDPITFDVVTVTSWEAAQEGELEIK